MFQSQHGTTKASASVGSSIVFETIYQNKNNLDPDQYSSKKISMADYYSDKKANLDSREENGNSSYQLNDEEIYSKPSELQYLTEYRSMKTACHELCHVFGMTHCPYFECLMNGSNLVNEAD